MAEIVRRVEEEGFVLLWSEVLKDLVAFYRPGADQSKIPPGFVPYSCAELFKLFRPGQPDPSDAALRRIHAAKKTGAGVTDVRSITDSATEN